MFGIFNKKQTKPKLVNTPPTNFKDRLDTSIRINTPENNTATSIRNEVDFHSRTLAFLIELRSILENSYGPNGSNTLIEHVKGNPIITKDGYTILNSLQFSNAQDSSLHDLIKRVAQNLVKTVGDGSTSSVILATYLYQNLINLKHFEGFNDKDLISIVEAISTSLYKILESQSKFPETLEERKDVLTKIANLSNNNDNSIGNYIADLFTKTASSMTDMIIEMDPFDSNNVLRHSLTYGFPYSTGLFHNFYFKKSSDLIIEDPLVYMSYELFADHLKNIDEILKEHPDRSIVVISEMIDDATQGEILSRYLSDKQKIYLIRCNNNQVEINHNEFIDLAVYLDSDVIRNPLEFKTSQIGSCKTVKFQANKSTFILGEGFSKPSEIFTEYVGDLKKTYLEMPDNLKVSKGLMKTRLNRLEGVSIKLYVGGITEEEKKARMFLVEDSVLACRSVIQKGYTFAGNISIAHAFAKLFNRIEEDTQYYITFPELFNFMELNSHRPKETITFIESTLSLYLSSVASTYMTLFKHTHTMEEAKDITFGIINKSMKESINEIFNIKTGKLELIENTSAISPTETDIQTLKAAVSIVSMLLSINQFIA